MDSRRTLKIHFTDFWHQFPYDNNYFIETLQKHYDVVLTDQEPDILFYSCYGTEYLKYSCHRIHYSAENVRADFSASDFAIGFDHIDNDRYYRLPLFFFYMIGRNATDQLLTPLSKEEAAAVWAGKTKFCCLVVSNAEAKERIRLFHELSKYKQVDSGGRYLNNVGGPVPDKVAFIKDYKFVISFENSSYPGYTTEKVLEPLLVNSIPVYWGNPHIDRDFNTRRLVVADRADDFSKVIEQIKWLDQNDDAAIDLLSQPVFERNELPQQVQEQNFEKMLVQFVARCATTVPVAITYKRHIHILKRKSNYFKGRLRSGMRKLGGLFNVHQ